MDSQQALGLMTRMYERIRGRVDDVRKYEQYLRGDQPLNYATREWQAANAVRYRGFSDNWCGVVVQAEAERLTPTGVANMDAGGASLLWDILRRNEFESQFSQGVVTSLATSRSYIGVWHVDGETMVSVEHPESVEIEYNFANPRIRDAALKTWVDDTWEYSELFTRSEVTRFRRKRGSVTNTSQGQLSQGRLLSYDMTDWQFVSERPNLLGLVPFVEIPNRPSLLGEPISEIAGVIPMQDAINLLWAYLFLAADYASMPARVALGTSPPKIPILDDKGQVIGERPVDMKDLAEKRLLYLSGENAKIDSWEAARLDVFTDTIEIAVGHIAAQTRTPPHYLVANKGISNLSGDALKSAEIGLTKKAREFITFTNPALREVLRLVALAEGDVGLAEEARLARIVWQDPEIRSEAQLADALLKKKQMGYPMQYILEQDGLDPNEIERVMGMIRAEQDLDPFGFGYKPLMEDFDDPEAAESGEAVS